MNKIPSFHFMGNKYLRRRKLVVFVIFTFFVFSSFGSISVREKVYLHFDKFDYFVGEDMWFKVYLFDAKTHKQENLSKIVYVDLIDGRDEIIQSRIIKIDQGFGQGDFHLSKKLLSGPYMVRAYTNHMRNFEAAYFFRKKIQINSHHGGKISMDKPLSSTPEEQDLSSKTLLKQLDVQFFPEGGGLVEGFVNRVGFKAIDRGGAGVDISGIIVDETGAKVSSIRSSKLGMGDFSFVPLSTKSYQAKIIYNNREFFYNLPLVQNKGVLMNVIDHHENYSINLQSSLPQGTKDLQVIAAMNGEVISKAILLEKMAKTWVQIPKSSLMTGLVQFVILDVNGNPLCKRLVFVDHMNPQPKVIISPLQNQYGTKELIELEIIMDRINQKESFANMSVAISDITFEPRDDFGLDIKSHLLLNSELRGEIEQPGYYFYSKEPQRKANLDLLMMCQSLGTYFWDDDIDNSNSGKSMRYPLEEGFSFKGHVKKYFNQKKSESVKVTLMVRNKELFEIDEIQTNDQGRFAFRDYDINDSTSVVIQAKRAKTKKTISKRSLEYPKMNYTIELDSFIPPEVTFKNNHGYLENMNDTNKYDNRSIIYTNSTPGLDESVDRIKLDEIELSTEIGLEKYDGYIKNKQLYRNPSQRVDFAELGQVLSGNVLQYLEGRVAGLSTQFMVTDSSGRSINGVVAFFNRTQNSNTKILPLYLLNGIPVDVTAIMMIPTSEVLFVDALRGTKAVIYGSEGAHGVIAVYTKDGSEIKRTSNQEKKGILSFVHTGYSTIREFYAPTYTPDVSNKQQPDQRITICWKPMIKLKEEGKAKISFYSADVATSYRVVLEGITEDGVPITSESFISIE